MTTLRFDTDDSIYSYRPAMKYKSITYQAVKNLGNYESHRLEMTVELEDNEDHSAAALSLMRQVNSILDAPPHGFTGKPTEDPEFF